MVDSISEALLHVQKAGGKVLTPRTDIGPSMGAFAAFEDPVGIRSVRGTKAMIRDNHGSVARQRHATDGAARPR